MGEFLTPDDIHARLAQPVAALAENLTRLCRRWAEAYQAGQISRPELLVNNVMPEKALGTLCRFHDEVCAKLESAIAGSYRYRDAERRATRCRKRRPRSRSTTKPRRR